VRKLQQQQQQQQQQEAQAQLLCRSNHIQLPHMTNLQCSVVKLPRTLRVLVHG
jgi:hypothetical protein